MNLKKLKKWKKIRTKGKLRFIMLTGVVTVGLSTSILSLITDKLRNRVEGFSIQSILLLLILHLIAGYIFGVFIWNLKEKEFLLRKDELNPKSN